MRFFSQSSARAIVPIAGFLFFSSVTTAYADTVTDWNTVIQQAIQNTTGNPPLSSRNLAITHIAIYDAINSIDWANGNGTYANYHYSGSAIAGTSRDAAAAEAAYTVLKSLYPTQTSLFDNQLALTSGGTPTGNAKALGDAVAADILNLRSNDGSVNTQQPYTGSTDVGKWRPTPNGNLNGLLPNWPNVTPFDMTSGSQFRQGPPPAVGSAQYITEYNEVKDYGSATSLLRTADQTDIAKFWSDGSSTVTPVGHWNRIAQTIGAANHNTLSQNARMFALLNIGQADAAIACWDMKYLYSSWRPITAIRLTDANGNPSNTDSGWTPLLTTPNFPSYTSGHATFSMASATILGQFIGTDNITFTTSTDAPGVADRTFTSLTQAAQEAADSRIYGGIHFRSDSTVGLAMGQQVGNWTINTTLMAAPEANTFALLAIVGIPALAVVGRIRRWK